MAWTIPRTWVVGETLTAALLNIHLRDNFKALGDPWITYTPVWAASATAPVVGNGTITGSYMQVGKQIVFKMKLTLGTTSTVGVGNYNWTAPVPANYGNVDVIGAATVYDSSAGSLTGIYARTAHFLNSTTFVMVGDGGGRVTASSPFIPASGDVFQVQGTYEAA